MSRPAATRVAPVLLALLLLVALPAPSSALLSGTFTVGPGGSYATLTAALADATTQGLGGPVVFELVAAYTSAGETFPLAIGAIAGSSPANTLTLRPQAGATALALTAPTGSVLTLTGATHVVVDGRPGGAGTSRELTLTCSSFSTVVVFTGGASNDTLRSLVIRGRSTSTTGGVVTFGLAGATQGNNDNVLEGCHLTAGSSLPTNLVYSAGSTLSRVYYNMRNTIRDCELSDWFSPTNNCSAVLLSSGNRAWTLNGNSLYQTAPRAFTAAARILQGYVTVTMDSLMAEDNWIGGSAPRCAGGPLTLTGTGGATFMSLLGDTVTTASVARNVLRNMDLTAGSGSTLRLMNLSGRMNVVDNVIGDSATTGSILANATTGQLHALAFAAQDTSRVTGNRVGGITATGTTLLVTGLQVGSANAASLEVRDNLVGSETVPESIRSSGSGDLIGIDLPTGSALPLVFTDNRVAHLRHSAASSANTLIGIRVAHGSCVVSGNRVHDLVSNAMSTAGVGGTSVVGILEAASPGLSLRYERNTIHSLSSTAVTSATQVMGMRFNFGAATVTVDRNLLHSFSTASLDTGATVTGLYVYSGAAIPAATFSNNMIRLGIDAAGGDATVAGMVQGVFCQGTHTYVGNTIHIGAVGGATPVRRSYAFYIWNAGSVPTLRNNILDNTRGSVALTGRHHALYMTSVAGVSTDFDLLHAPGSTGVLVGVGSIVYTTFPLWSATGHDVNGVTGDPRFVDADGPASSVDLHIDAAADPPSPVSGAGATWVGWTFDFDGTLRDGAAPDIGADEYAELLAVEDGDRPVRAFLSHARPNPVRGDCVVEFGLARAGHAALELFDVRGRRVRTLSAGHHEAGRHAIRWDGRAADGSGLAPGTYFLRLAADGVRETRRLAVLR